MKLLAGWVWCALFDGESRGEKQGLASLQPICKRGFMARPLTMQMPFIILLHKMMAVQRGDVANFEKHGLSLAAATELERDLDRKIFPFIR